MRLAYFSPLPPTRSGIADYSATLLPPLAAEVEITAFAAPDAPVPTGIPTSVSCRSVVDCDPAEFDLSLYQMGNSAHHVYIYRQLLRNPGILVLHEPHLHHFTAHITAGQGDFDAYVREMGYAYGPAGAALARAIRAGRAAHPLHVLPLMERLVDSSLGIIVHSHYARDIVERGRPGVRTALIASPMQPRAAEPADWTELGIPSDALVIAAVGQVTPEKQIPAALRAFARLRDQRPEIRFLIIGEVPSWYQAIDEAVRSLRLETVVYRTGYLPDLDVFERWIAAADLCVCLRAPTLGETSAGLLRIMALGKPALVCDVGWYAELPRDVCHHVPLTPTGEVDEAKLAAAMMLLADDPAGRRTMGERAQAYVAQYHRLAESADAYLDFMQATLNVH